MAHKKIDITAEALHEFDKIRWAKVGKCLRPFFEEPERITKLRLHELQKLWQQINETQTFWGLSDEPKGNVSTGTVAQELTKVVQLLSPKVRSELNRRYRYREYLISGVVIFFYILMMAYLVAGEWIDAIPWFLVLGTSLLWLIAKALDRYLVEGGEHRLGTLLPTPRGILLLPILSCLIIVLLFWSPSTFGLQVFATGTIIKPVPLTISCDSSVKVGPLLQPGDMVRLENIIGKECLRVSTYDGRVGFITRRNVEINKQDTLQQLKTTTFLLMMALVMAIGCYWIGCRLYSRSIAPVLLARKAARHQEQLKKHIEEADLLKEFTSGGQILTTLDIQKAKDDLVLKLVERFDEQSRKIVESTTLTPKEKDQMLANLTKWTIEALGEKKQQ